MHCCLFGVHCWCYIGMTMQRAAHLESSPESNLESSTPTTSTSKRRRFANSERLAIVRNVRRRLEGGESIRGACRALNIIPKQYREWSTKLDTMIEHNPKAKSVCKGPTSILKPIESDLLTFILELRVQGLAVSISAVVSQVCRLMPEFQQKSIEARYQCVRRWIRRQGLTHRIETQECQQPQSDTASSSPKGSNGDLPSSL